MQTDLITKVYFNEHLTHSCVGMPQGLQALLSSFLYVLHRIWSDKINIIIIIHTSHHACHKKQLIWACRVVCYKGSSASPGMKMGISRVVGNDPGYGFNPSVSKSAVPNNGIQLGIKSVMFSFPTLPVLWSHVDVIFVYI